MKTFPALNLPSSQLSFNLVNAVFYHPLQDILKALQPPFYKLKGDDISFNIHTL